MNAVVPFAQFGDDEPACLVQAMQQSVLWLVLDDVIGEMLGMGVPVETVRSMTERALRREPAASPDRVMEALTF